MTPTASRLKARLDERRRWFLNEWFFKWHFIGNDTPVSIESFDGREIRYGGIQYSGSARLVYWDAIARGVRKEVVEQFTWVDDEIRKYNHPTAVAAIDQCSRLLISFAAQIRRDAVEKDRVLRGNGVDFPPQNDAGRWIGISEREILNEAKALKVALPEADVHLTFSKHALEFWHSNQWWIGTTGLIVSIAGLAATLI